MTYEPCASAAVPARIRAVLGLAVVMLSGCATSGNANDWYLNGRTQSQFQADQRNCREVAAGAMDESTLQQAGGGIARGGKLGALGSAMAALEWAKAAGNFDSCMESRGYVQRR